MISNRKSIFKNFTTKSSSKSNHSLYSLKQHKFAIRTSVYPVPEESVDIGYCSSSIYNSSKEDINSIVDENNFQVIEEEEEEKEEDIDINRFPYPPEGIPLSYCLSLSSTSPSSSAAPFEQYQQPYIDEFTSPRIFRTSFIAATKPALPSYQSGIRIPTPLHSPGYPSSLRSISTSRSLGTLSGTMEYHPRNHRGHAVHSHVPHHMAGALSTDTLSSSYSNHTTSSSGGEVPYTDGSSAVYDADYPPQGKHKKKNSESNVMEEVFGIYPEPQKMGHGVSVADVMASKLFKWGSKARTPSTIPTPQPSAASSSASAAKVKPKSTGNSSCRGRPLPPSHHTAPLPTPPPSNTPSTHSFGNEPVSREPAQRSQSHNVIPHNQPRLDGLLARQRLLEEKIQQLKLERNAMLELDVDRSVRNYDSREREYDRPYMQPVQHALPQQPVHHALPQQPPRRAPVVRPESPEHPPLHIPRHNASSAVHTRSFQSTTSSLLSSGISQDKKQARHFPPSNKIQPLKTTPMAIPSATRTTTAPYTQRPPPETPIDATPPPEYDHVIPTHIPTTKSYDRYGDDVEPDSPTCKDMKISFPMPPASAGNAHEILLEKNAGLALDPRPSPKGEEIETEEILGWLDTMSPTNVASLDENKVMRMAGGPPSIPLPKPPGDVKHPAAIDPSTYSYYGRDTKLPIPEVEEPADLRTGRDEKKLRASKGVHFDGEKRQRSRTRLSTRPPAAQAAYRARENERTATLDVM